jgi:hypothetical protein
VIAVRGLTKRYGDTLAVDDLSVDVEPVVNLLGWLRLRRDDANR